MVIQSIQLLEWNRLVWVCETMELFRFLYIIECLAYRIHSSETTAALLEEIGGFQLEYRGITEIKVS